MSTTSAADALASLDKAAWASMGPEERLDILKKIKVNLYNAMEELAAEESSFKADILGTSELFPKDLCKITTAVPMGNNLNGAIDLYTALVAGKAFAPKAGKPVQVNNTKDELWDVPICANTYLETLFYATRKDKLRVVGKPKQTAPYEKVTQIVGILGAGNYSSAVEIVKSIFFDNQVAVHKPHPLNAKADLVWARVLAPLVQAKALAFCDAEQGKQLTSHPLVEKIYFTGGVDTAKAIMKGLPAERTLICEAGGVNPVLVVPDVWTDAQIQHHAQQIITGAKANGGHVCARPQVVVTSKAWPQRRQFLQALEKAVLEDTFASGSYYPTANKVKEEFAKAYPEVNPLHPEDDAYGKVADFMLITDDKMDGYATKHEAFCQVLTEVGLDTENNAADFLAKAVPYVNSSVTGSLCAGILIPDTARKTYPDAYEQAISDLEYGSIGTNLLPLHVFFSQYTMWGVNEKEHFGKKELLSGNGNFGNVFGYENVQKTIIDDLFVSPLQLKFLNKKATFSTVAAMSRYSVWPSWFSLFSFFLTAVPGSLKGRDW